MREHVVHFLEFVGPHAIDADRAESWYVEFKPGSMHEWERLVSFSTPNSSVVKQSSLLLSLAGHANIQERIWIHM